MVSFKGIPRFVPSFFTEHQQVNTDPTDHSRDESAAIFRWFYPKKGWVMGLRREMDFQWRITCPSLSKYRSRCPFRSDLRQALVSVRLLSYHRPFSQKDTQQNPKCPTPSIYRILPWGITYGSILRWMNIPLPPILMFTRGTGF